MKVNFQPAPAGWYQFGEHANWSPVPDLEFSEELDDCGLPLWERVKPATSGEVRTVSSSGGEKGSKLAQLGAVDPLALLEVAKVAGYGAQKYARYNFIKGYDWSLSYDALQRHLLAFWSGEDIDPESGLPHAAHAAWHCLTLIHFTQQHPGFDDRPTQPVNPAEAAEELLKLKLAGLTGKLEPISIEKWLSCA